MKQEPIFIKEYSHKLPNNGVGMCAVAQKNFRGKRHVFITFDVPGGSFQLTVSRNYAHRIARVIMECLNKSQ
jgi:hypothetical protein